MPKYEVDVCVTVELQRTLIVESHSIESARNWAVILVDKETTGDYSYKEIKPIEVREVVDPVELGYYKGPLHLWVWRKNES